MNGKKRRTLVRYAAAGAMVALLAACAARRQTGEPETLPVPVEGREILLDRVCQAAYREDSTERRVDLSVGGKSVGGTLRMIGGRRIWFNVSVLGITFARAMFTPDSLMYYEKVGKTAFEGRWDDFHRLSSVLSALDYALVENLLCGRSAFDLQAEDFLPLPTDGKYAFTHRDTRSGVTLAGTVDARTFRVERQELRTPDGKTGLTVEYAYSGEEALPGSVTVTLTGDSQRVARLDYFPVRRMQAQFPFRVPDGYRDAREWLRALGVDI